MGLLKMTNKKQRRRFNQFDFDVKIAGKYIRLALIQYELCPEIKTLFFDYDESVGCYIDDAILKHIFEMMILRSNFK